MPKNRPGFSVNRSGLTEITSSACFFKNFLTKPAAPPDRTGPADYLYDFEIFHPFCDIAPSSTIIA